MSLIHFIDKKFYSDYSEHWDDTLFREIILMHLKEEFSIIDVGAGSGSLPQMNFRGMCQKVCGIDPDPNIQTNLFLDETIVSTAENIPYTDNTFDLAFSANVWEHLLQPSEVLKEVHRVLKPGGIYLSKTPNMRHYMPIIAKVTPKWFHVYFNKLRGRTEQDTFETLYRINTTRKIKKYAERAGFHTLYLKQFEGRPEYLRFFFITYFFGLLYERIVNSSIFFKEMRIVHIVVLKKPEL